MWILMEYWGQGINLVPLLNRATHADHYTGKCNNIQRIFSNFSYFSLHNLHPAGSAVGKHPVFNNDLVMEERVRAVN